VWYGTESVRAWGSHAGCINPPADHAKPPCLDGSHPALSMWSLQRPHVLALSRQRRQGREPVFGGFGKEVRRRTLSKAGKAEFLGKNNKGIYNQW
jgi:hypothetical protein